MNPLAHHVDAGLLWAVPFVAGAWLAPRRWQGPVMTASALGFIATEDPRSAAGVYVAALASHLLLLGRPGRVRLCAVVAATVAFLVWSRWGVRFGEESPARLLGVSFYALRIIHVAVDRVRGRLEACTFLEYLHYLAFLPSFSSGPIHRLDDFLRDGRRRRWSSARSAVGLERILYGCVKVVVFGDWLVSSYLGAALSATRSSSFWVREYAAAWLDWANLYFQFAGRADVAIGLAALVGYVLPENFERPFLAPNISNFWLRWHITLGAWCRDFVFQPVMAITRSPVAGILSSMLVIGLWHELSPRYVLWGLYHGAGIAFWRLLQLAKRRWAVPTGPWLAGAMHGASVALTLSFVVLSHSATTHVLRAMGFVAALPSGGVLDV